MGNGFLVFLEYAQALLILIFYWLRALVFLFIKPERKSVRNEIILITGAGETRILMIMKFHFFTIIF